MGRMTIGQFARAGGVGVETVRYYQRRGLLPVPAPGATSYREYDEAAVRRLRFIRQAQAAGFTLEEIRELIALDRTHDRDRIRAIAAGKLAKLRTHIAELRAAGRALEGLIHECGHGRKGTPCPIITAFDTAVHRRGRAGHC